MEGCYVGGGVLQASRSGGNAASCPALTRTPNTLISTTYLKNLTDGSLINWSVIHLEHCRCVYIHSYAVYASLSQNIFCCSKKFWCWCWLHWHGCLIYIYDQAFFRHMVTDLQTYLQLNGHGTTNWSCTGFVFRFEIRNPKMIYVSFSTSSDIIARA